MDQYDTGMGWHVDTWRGGVGGSETKGRKRRRRWWRSRKWTRMRQPRLGGGKGVNAIVMMRTRRCGGGRENLIQKEKTKKIKKKKNIWFWWKAYQQYSLIPVCSLSGKSVTGSSWLEAWFRTESGEIIWSTIQLAVRPLNTGPYRLLQAEFLIHA